jgi:hypothetical protein
MRFWVTISALGWIWGSVLQAAAIEPQYAERVADAIYRAEGGPRAKVPYGILSVPVRNEQEARKVCLNTIRNNWQRWTDAGQPGHFIDFLGNRYCPPSADPVGNRNWRRNVKSLLSRDYPDEKDPGLRDAPVESVRQENPVQLPEKPRLAGAPR